jgi:uncharacterized protein (DUF1684 family)
MATLLEFRKQKDEYFKTDRNSPLTGEQKASFGGLNYFDENPALRFELELEFPATPREVILQTSTGDEQEYTHVGQVRFSVNGEEAILQVYENQYGFFLPFVDATAPGETYGAGRYLEPEDLGGHRILLDFNLAYNPYCAYNERWSCPLPPLANRLKVRIEAGEKNFH